MADSPVVHSSSERIARVIFEHASRISRQEVDLGRRRFFARQAVIASATCAVSCSCKYAANVAADNEPPDPKKLTGLVKLARTNVDNATMSCCIAHSYV